MPPSAPALPTVMPAGTGILTVEYRLNCLAPGVGERIRLIGRDGVVD